MAQPIHFELVSPEAKLVSEPVAHAVLPGEEGEFGVGAGHTSLVAALKPGVVKLYLKDMNAAKPDQFIFIAGGFADVTGARCVVLAEEATNLSLLKSKDLEKQIEQLESGLRTAVEAADKLRIGRHLALVHAKLEAIEAISPRAA